MIYQFATKIAMGLSHKQYIPSDEIDIVSYGLFSVISKIMYGIISLILGMIFGCIIESACFYICFLFIKKYAGGFHAKTEFRCFLLSSFSIAVSVTGIFISKRIVPFALFVMGISFISYFLIAFFAPVPSKERPLDKEEYKRYNTISKIRVVVLIFIELLTYILGYLNICVSMCFAVILESVLLIAGKIKMKNI